MHNYKVNGPKTGWIKVLFLYPKCTKPHRSTSICKIKKVSGVIPGPPLKGMWWDKGRERGGGGERRRRQAKGIGKEGRNCHVPDQFWEEIDDCGVGIPGIRRATSWLTHRQCQTRQWRLQRLRLRDADHAHRRIPTDTGPQPWRRLCTVLLCISGGAQKKNIPTVSVYRSVPCDTSLSG